MLLCIDTGNTNTVFSVWDGSAFLGTWRASTEHQRTADQYYVWLSTLMSAQGLRDVVIDEVVISSTVPRVVFNLRVLCDRYFGCRPLVVGKPECLLPVPSRVDEGVRPGPDRLANAAGAFERHGGNAVVVDFGTATNFDVVAEDGAYVGGVIAPGVNLSLEALAAGAAALPHVDITQPEKVIGTNTVECIQSGVFWGYTGLIEGITARIKAEFGVPMKVVGTGGLAPLFAKGDMLFDVVEEDLTMFGLTVIHRFNKENQ
ncbi:MAG: type III pantothenate kinase [Boseongicola sp.]|nr:type III pantothenate kinase [Boseongicola sp.]NNJ69148.1 type III pantothenate kinase [Boseongicola sp.]